MEKLTHRDSSKMWIFSWSLQYVAEKTIGIRASKSCNLLLQDVHTSLLVQPRADHILEVLQSLKKNVNIAKQLGQDCYKLKSIF